MSFIYDFLMNTKKCRFQNVVKIITNLIMNNLSKIKINEKNMGRRYVMMITNFFILIFFRILNLRFNLDDNKRKC